jgi:hypothetical protein
MQYQTFEKAKSAEQNLSTVFQIGDLSDMLKIA